MLFDTHLHFSEDDNPSEILATARDAGVSRFLIAVSTLQEAIKAAEIADAESATFSMAGVHPHEAKDVTDEILCELRKLTDHKKVVAIGEIGLDYYYDYSPREVQQQVFRDLLQMALDTNLPVVIHCRDAWQDCLPIMKEYLKDGHPFVVHSFTGTPEEAKELLAMGGYISFNGMLTFKKANNIRQNLSVVPLDRILIETDSPYLAPVPKRGKRNTPAYVKYIAEYLADYLGKPLNEVIEQTTQNGIKLFQLPTENK